MLAAIEMRKHLDEIEVNRKLTWAVRSLGTLIAGGYMVEKGKANPGQDYVEQLAYDDLNAALLGVVRDEKAGGTGKNGGVNGVGSFERAQMLFGQVNAKAAMS